MKVAGADLTVVRGGKGKPLLMLHDELGYPGWMTWNEELAKDRQLIIPLQPGFGKTPKIDWIRSFRDLAGFYANVVRELIPVGVWSGQPVTVQLDRHSIARPGAERYGVLLQQGRGGPIIGAALLSEF